MEGSSIERSRSLWVEKWATVVAAMNETPRNGSIRNRGFKHGGISPCILEKFNSTSNIQVPNYSSSCRGVTTTKKTIRMPRFIHCERNPLHTTWHESEDLNVDKPPIPTFHPQYLPCPLLDSRSYRFKGERGSGESDKRIFSSYPVHIRSMGLAWVEALSWLLEGDEPDGFVKVFVDDCFKYSTATINNDRNPRWQDMHGRVASYVFQRGTLFVKSVTLRRTSKSSTSWRI